MPFGIEDEGFYFGFGALGGDFPDHSRGK